MTGKKSRSTNSAYSMTLAQKLQAVVEKIRYQYNRLFHYQVSPFGPAYQEAWNHRYALFSKFDLGIRTDAVGLYSVTPEKTAGEIAANISAGTIVDAFCGIGGTTIAFAAAGKIVYAIDIDPKRLEMARYNAGVYQQTDIEFIAGDFLHLAPQIHADAVFLDPPWGGPPALDKKTFHLNDFFPNGQQLLQTAFQYFTQVVLRVPEQFELSELKDYKYHEQPNFLEGRVISRTVYFYAKN